MGKKGEFEEAADHLVFAIGGNFSEYCLQTLQICYPFFSPKCGDKDDNSTEAMKVKVI